MRRTVIALACVASLGLGACSTTGGTTTSASVDQTIAQVQQVAAQVCGYLPTIQTVAGILSTFTNAGSAVASAASIGQQICAAVAPKSIRKRGLPMVRGVVVRGTFIR